MIDRYSDLVVLLGIVVLFARTPHARGALVAMAGLVGSVMVSYTKARAESIGVECNVGVHGAAGADDLPHRRRRCFGLMEPALWVLAVLANLTALQRIVFTRRAAALERPVPRRSRGRSVLLAGRRSPGRHACACRRHRAGAWTQRRGRLPAGRSRAAGARSSAPRRRSTARSATTSAISSPTRSRGAAT